MMKFKQSLFIIFLGTNALSYGTYMSNTEHQGRSDTGVSLVESNGTEFFSNPAATSSYQTYVVGVDYAFGLNSGFVVSAIDSKSSAVKAGFAYSNIFEQEVAMNFSYPVMNVVALGVTAFRTIETKDTSADLGALIFAGRYLSFGANVRNVYSDKVNQKGMIYQVGTQLTYPDIARLLVDYEFKKSASGAAEFFLGDSFILRAGYSLEGDVNYSGGFTWKAPKLHLGYSLLNTDVEFQHWTKFSVVM